MKCVSSKCKKLDPKIVLSYVIIAVVYLVWILVIPPLQTPDEQAHLRYVEYISQNRKLPGKEVALDKELFGNSENIEYLIEMTQADRIFHNTNLHYDFGSGLTSDIDGFNANHILNHPPLYYILSAFFYSVGMCKSVGFALFLVRSSNIIWALVAFHYSRKLAAHFFKGIGMQIVTGMAVVLFPMFTFIGSGVNNDVLLFASFFATLYYLVKIIDTGKLVYPEMWGLAVWLSVGILSKAPYLAVVPVIVIVIGIQVFKMIKKKDRIGLRALSVLLLPLLIGGAYFLWNVSEFGSLYPKPAGGTGIVFDNPNRSDTPPESVTFLHLARITVHPRYSVIVQNFIGNFGWLDSKFPVGVYVVTFLIAVIGFGFFLFDGVADRLKNRSIRWRFDKYAVLVASVLSLELLYIALFIRTYFLSGYTGFPTQGRYYFPVLLPLVLLIFGGYQRIFPARMKRHLPFVMVALVLLLHVTGFGLILYRYYL